MQHTLQWSLTMLLATALTAVAGEPKTMNVQVRKGQLRSTPSYLSRVTATVKYTDRVAVFNEQNGWLRVRPVAGGAEGWIHKTALTRKKLTLTSGEIDATRTVSTEEQALAGKGFNADVEAEFKNRNEAMDFTWVDRMEKITIPVSTLTQFLKAGAVRPAKGGAQ